MITIPTGPRLLLPNACYHLITRGNQRQEIFLDKQDYALYLVKLKHYKKAGHLWQGRFKSKVIAKDGYLIDCIQYVEHNPVRANMVKAAGEYLYSSYRKRALGNDNRGILDELHL